MLKDNKYINNKSENQFSKKIMNIKENVNEMWQHTDKTTNSIHSEDSEMNKIYHK